MINDKFMLEWHDMQKANSPLSAGIDSRNLLATFRGTIIDKPGWGHYSRGIRQKWLKKYEFDDKIKITPVHPREGFGAKAANYQATYRKDFTSSKFCLCPPGWATWTPRLFEALLLGCIPAVVATFDLGCNCAHHAVILGLALLLSPPLLRFTQFLGASTG